MAGRRRFGSIRKLPSGRFQVRYVGPDGIERPAPETFATKTEAAQWLSKTEAEILNDDWINPDAGKILLRDYGAAWISERPKIKPRTRKGYRDLLKNQIVPRFGQVCLGDLSINEIKASHVRRWHKELGDAGMGEPTIARAYQLLKSIMNTAVDDEAIRRNPCRIEGGAQNDTPERPTLTVEEVFTLAGEVPLRFQLLVLLATFASMRWGELVALERRDIEVESHTIHVRRTATEVGGEPIFTGTPKSAAGVRDVTFPEEILPELAYHLDTYVGPEPTARVFASWEGGYLHRSNFNKVWITTRTALGLPDVHFHDLRHTGNTLGSENGATLQDLMARMGHSTMRAALIYLHKTSGGDKRIARTLGEKIAEARKPREDPPRT